MPVTSGTRSLPTVARFPVHAAPYPRRLHPLFVRLRMVGYTQLVAKHSQLVLITTAYNRQHILFAANLRMSIGWCSANVARIDIVRNLLKHRCRHAATVLIPASRILDQHDGAVLGRMRREVTDKRRDVLLGIPSVVKDLRGTGFTGDAVVRTYVCSWLFPSPQHLPATASAYPVFSTSRSYRSITSVAERLFFLVGSA